MADLPSPIRPKLRPLDVRYIVDQGQPFFLLRDPLGLTEQVALVPQALGPLLTLCDGTRDPGAIAAALAITTSLRLTPDTIAGIVESLSRALLLDDERFAQAYRIALQEYREAPFRKPALAGKAYPEDPKELEETLRAYCEKAQDGRKDAAPPAHVAGVISPHIDYHRGWPVYASVWQRAGPAIQDVDLVIVFGTDHAGGPGRLTLTRQHYATPWGILPTDRKVVEALAVAIGEEEAFAEELHHRNEHSVELALVWLHHFLRPRQCGVVPVLCGSFHTFIAGQGDPGSHPTFEKALAALRLATQGRRTLIVAAADLAHVGPNFGDPAPWNEADRSYLRLVDETLLQAVIAGDPHRWFAEIQSAGDRYRVCGMPPIYLTLRMLEGASGMAVGYDQCPADPEGGSLVSVAGALLQAAS